MKRIISFMLTVAIMLGAAVLYVRPVRAESDMQASSELVAILKIEEGFLKYPTWDYSQYSVGYGTRCPDDMLAYYLQYGITEYEAEQLLRQHLHFTEKTINQKLIDKFGLSMTQGQFDALVSFSYNMGTAWITDEESNIRQKVLAGATGNEMVDALSRWCKAGGKVLDYLVRRRLSEARMYLEGEYSRTVPDNYCYVTYNGNGGATSHSAQGYCTDAEAIPSAEASYGDYTFSGWYTKEVGGTKVTSLTKEHNGMTLYAHWKELHPDGDEMAQPVTVTITAGTVNIRKGPGTNYSIVGAVHQGTTCQVTQTYDRSGFLWGYIGSGWIALQYTNFDSVKPEPLPPTEPEVTEPEITEPEVTEPEGTEPEVTDPDVTEPEVTEPEIAEPGVTEPGVTEPEVTEPEITEPEGTEPEVTEPEVTEPEVTEPEVTEPEVTEPEVTEPPVAEPSWPKTMTGVINANPYLCVRSGPGTTYATVDTLQTGEHVEILEQRVSGSMIWGRISNGWISMSYVILDRIPTTGSPTPSPTGKIGTVTCSSLNIRSGAGITFGLVGYYIKGETVEILEEKTVKSTTWGKTNRGWVSMDYIELKDSEGGNTGGSQPGDTTPAPQEQTGIVVSDDFLRIRAGAGTNFAIVGFLSPNTKVTVTAVKTVNNVTWGKIQQGWISMDYIKLDKTETDPPEAEDPGQAPDKETPPADIRTVTATSLCVRTGAGTNYSVVGYLMYGEKVTILETKTVFGLDWGRTQQGWICLKYAIPV